MGEAMNRLPVKAEPRPRLPVRYDPDALEHALSAFESETTGVIASTAPRNERVVLHVLVLMLLVAVALAAVVKLDRVVSGAGQIISVGGQLYVSPLNAGVVQEVLVKSGDLVRKGQTLATLDPTLAQADVTQLSQKLESDEAAIARLEAELEGKPYVPPGEGSYALTQDTIWRQRRAEYQATVASYDAQIANARAIIARYENDSQQYRKRLELASEVTDMYEPLVRKGYVSRLQLMSATDSREEMERRVTEAQNQIAAQRSSEASLRAQRSVYVEKWRADVAAQLVGARNSASATREELQKAQRMLELSTLTAPADAIVLKVGKISTGSVASTSSGALAEPLFTLVPMDAPLEAEMNVANQDIAFIRTGDEVSIKFDAYSFVRHGMAKGVVKAISEGSFTTDDNNQPVRHPYFKVRLAITDVNLHDVPPDFRLVPGMTVTGDVLVGERTILSYITEGTLRTGAEAMREAQ